MKPSLFVVLVGVLFCREAHAFSWSCGSEDHVKIDVLHTPTNRQVGLLYGATLEDGKWLGSSTVPLSCHAGGSSTANLMNCSVIGSENVTIHIYRGFNGDPPFAHLEAKLSQGEMTLDLPCH